MRLKAILAALESSGLASKLSMREAPEARREHLERVHDAQHVDLIFESAPERGYAYLDPDTSMNAKSLSAALRAAGAVVSATDAVIAGDASNAFCAVRPPGHHATPTRPMGFCIFNNVAIGAMHAIEQHGLERVAVLDFDVHHGNGTEDAFHEDPRVMLCSTFQHPYYPYCGADSGNEHIINVPLPAMTDGRGFARPSSASGSPRWTSSRRRWCSYRRDSTRTATIPSRTSSWTTRTIAGSPRS
jgi:acetoin utilization deacetylase AcuC-like enzyme